jgi:hypothetical protein
MILNMRLLKDGTGRVCIHYFVRDASGPIVTPKGEGQLANIGGTKGYIACNRQQNTVGTQIRNGEHMMCVNSDDPRAVTCPDCLATDEAKRQLTEYGEMVDVAAQLQ